MKKKSSLCMSKEKIDGIDENPVAKSLYAVYDWWGVYTAAFSSVPHFPLWILCALVLLARLFSD